MDQDNENIKEDEIDLREIFRIFLNRKWWFIGSVIVVLLIGFLYILMQPITYTATWRFDIGKDYINDRLSEFYPNKANELNFINVDNTPSLFRTDDVFRPLEYLEGVDDYNRWLLSDAVTISQNENTTIFDVSVSRTEKELAGNIAIALVNSFDEFLKSESKDAFNSVLDTIKADVKLLENENSNFENVLLESDEELDSLYEKLDSYIMNYNLELVKDIERESTSGNYSFYSLVVPPNKIQDEISEIREEREFYKQIIFNNQTKLIDLENLKEILERDKEVITERIRLLTKEPAYKSESNRKRNLAVVVFLSILAGVVIVFIISYFRGDLKQKE